MCAYPVTEQEIEMAYGIWTTVSGGITGYRAAWLKHDDAEVVFATQAEAEAEAGRLTAGDTLRGGYTPSGRPIAVRSFRALARND